MAESKKPEPNWAQIEVDYRAGVKPLRLIAEENGITHGAINKRAKRDSWARDLKAKIVAAAEAKVSKAAVSAEVSTDTVVTEQQVVEANAELQYQIRIEHRQDIKRTRKLFQQLLGQIELTSTEDGRSLLHKLMLLLSGEDGSDAEGKRRVEKMQEMLDKVIGLPSAIDGAKKLTEMLEKLVKMERQAFGIDDDEKGVSEVDRVLQKIANGG